MSTPRTPLSPTIPSSKNGWSFVTSIPTDRFDIPIPISGEEFIVAPYHSHYWRTNGLYKFNTIIGKWIETEYKYPSNIRTSFHTSAYDKVNKILYIYNKEALLIIINLESEECQIKRVSNVGKYAASVVINGEFHIIGGFKSNKHMKWSVKDQRFIEIFHFKEAGIGYYLHKLCYIESKQVLISMGGYVTTTRSSRSCDHIYLYDIRNNKWHRSPISMPRRMYSFGYILTPNEKYIIIFGGNTTNHVHIFDLHKQKMVRLSQNIIQCPINGGFHACVMSNYKKGKKLINGWVKKLWKRMEFKKVRKLNYDLIQLIIKWYCTEEVHLIHFNKKEHWKRDLAEIVNAYENMKI